MHKICLLVISLSCACWGADKSVLTLATAESRFGDGPLASTTTEYGQYLALASSGTRNTTRTLQVDFTKNATLGIGDAGTAIWANAKSGGSSSFNHFVGVQSYADHAGSGTVNAVYGLNTYLFNSGGGTISNLFGLHIAPPVTMAGVTNAYGIYIGDFTASKYAIYTGTGITRLGGSLKTVGCAEIGNDLTVMGGARMAEDLSIGEPLDSTAALRVGSVPSPTYGNVHIADTRPSDAGVGGVMVFAGKYTDYNDYANFAEIKGVKKNGTEGNFEGKLVIRIQKGSSPYMMEVLSSTATSMTIAVPVTVDGSITVGSTTLITSSVPLSNAAGTATATMTNAPLAGNPTKWITINDNGTLRRIPTW